MYRVMYMANTISQEIANENGDHLLVQATLLVLSKVILFRIPLLEIRLVQFNFSAQCDDPKTEVLDEHFLPMRLPSHLFVSTTQMMF